MEVFLHARTEHAYYWFLLLTLSVISGFADSQGFIHASRIWQGDRLVISELGKSTLGFAAGIATYVFSLRYLNRVGSFAPELQALLWFAITLVGVAITSKQFLTWRAIDQTVGVAVLVGIGWLFMRTGSAES